MEYKAVGLDRAMKEAIGSVTFPKDPFDILYKTG
jgi:hypothetical protein